MLVIIYQALHDLGPSYLKNHLALQISAWALRSITEGLVQVPPITKARVEHRAGPSR